MKKEMKIVLPFYKIAYAVSFVVILSVIRAVVFTYEIGLSIEPPFAILTAVFCADTYVQEITSNRSEVQRLYQIKKRIYSIIQRLMIQGTFLLLLAVLGYGLFFAFQKKDLIQDCCLFSLILGFSFPFFLEVQPFLWCFLGLLLLDNER